MSRSGASAVAASTVRPACKRARHDFEDDKSNESSPIIEWARYYDRSDDESSSFSQTSSDISMRRDVSSTDGSMSPGASIDADAPRVEKWKRAPSSARPGRWKRRGIEAVRTIQCWVLNSSIATEWQVASKKTKRWLLAALMIKKRGHKKV